MAKDTRPRERIDVTLFPDIEEEKEACRKVRSLKKKRELRGFLVEALTGQSSENGSIKADLEELRADLNEMRNDLKEVVSALDHRFKILEEKMLTRLDTMQERALSNPALENQTGPDAAISEDDPDEGSKEYVPMSDEEIIEIGTHLDLDILSMFPQD